MSIKIYPAMAIEYWCETRYEYTTTENKKYFYGSVKNDIFFFKCTSALIDCPLCGGTHYISIEDE